MRTASKSRLGHDARIGRRSMRPGLGFGGGCLPKDIRGFMARAGELGVDQALTILREVDAINNRRRERMVDLARQQLDGTLAGQRVTVWGAAFKSNTDEIRDSPALAVAQKLHELGATVTVTDPQALDNARKTHPELDYVEDPIAAVQDADLLLHLTEWPQYSHVDPHRLAARTASPKVIDGRGTLNADTWRKAGWTVCALGRPLPRRASRQARTGDHLVTGLLDWVTGPKGLKGLSFRHRGTGWRTMEAMSSSDTTVTVTFTADEYAAVTEQAAQRGVPLNTYVRQAAAQQPLTAPRPARTSGLSRPGVLCCWWAGGYRSECRKPSSRSIRISP
ncbi:UDP binding domain-containing protein [Streptomyces sp. NPDC002285]